MDEPEHFSGFYESCQHWRTMSRDKALQAFRFLTAEEQGLARAASPLHAAECDKAKRRSLDAHKLIAERFWIKYPSAKLPPKQAPAPEAREIVGDELAGLRLATRIGDQRELATDRPIMTRKAEIQRDLAALAPFVDLPKSELMIVEQGTPQFSAWRDRLKAWLGIDPSAERIWLEPLNPAIHNLPTLHKDFRLRKSVEGFRVPRQWPPRRDGSWADDQNEGAA
ncbi:MAG: hypothetical protein KGL35_05685 [Bradyrhizobium sp.]|nr:hypothetical protein [Bradyrhizobium sp.]